MKTQRLLSMLLLLQTRRRMTAPERADELGVPVRTVLPDVTARSDADVPTIVERGRYGRVVLLPGSQLDVSRLNSDGDRSVVTTGSGPRSGSADRA